MASFVVEGSSTTVRPLSQNLVQKVILIYVKTVPEGITFTYVFPYESWVASGGVQAMEAVVEGVAIDVQSMAADPSVASVYGAEDTLPSGLLTEVLIVTVQVPSRDTPAGGFLTEDITVPVSELGNPEFAQFTWQAQVAAAKGRLDAAAAA